jgi:hypothetical protein
MCSAVSNAAVWGVTGGTARVAWWLQHAGVNNTKVWFGPLLKSNAAPFALRSVGRSTTLTAPLLSARDVRKSVLFKFIVNQLLGLKSRQTSYFL